MAATDRIQIFMTLTGDRFWTNVFHVNALTVDTAASFANTVLAPALAAPMDGSFRVIKTLVSHIADDTFVTTPLNIAGGSAGSPYLALFNTVKVLIGVAGHGRNDYKFLRGVVTEANQNNGQLDSGVMAAVDAIWNGVIADGTAAGVDMVDTQGNLWLVASVQKAVQMRQLHRKRKKVLVP